MRNLWVGMIFGAATGAAIGAIVDGGKRARELAVESGHSVTNAVKAHAPDIRERIQAADLPTKAHDALERAREAHVVERARDAHVVDAAKRAAENVREVVTHAAGSASDQVRHRTGHATDES